MPADNFIVQHWYSELEIFREKLALLKNELNSEAVHDWRVAVKKLRSYVKLHGIIFENSQHENLFNETKYLFSVLGRHRNLETSFQLFLNYAKRNENSFPSVKNYFEILLSQTFRFCQLALQEYDSENLNKLTHQIEQNANETDLGKVKKIIDSDFKSIHRDLKHFNQRFHHTRKQLKNIFYWLKILPGNIVFPNKKLSSVNKTLDYLGAMQDHEVLRRNLRYFRKNILPAGTKEFQEIKKIEKRVLNKKNNLSEKAQKKIREFF
jgi:CHAD domain-containing protein